MMRFALPRDSKAQQRGDKEGEVVEPAAVVDKVVRTAVLLVLNLGQSKKTINTTKYSIEVLHIHAVFYPLFWSSRRYKKKKMVVGKGNEKKKHIVRSVNNEKPNSTTRREKEFLGQSRGGQSRA